MVATRHEYKATDPRAQILKLWANDPYLEILDYGEIAELTGLDLAIVVSACRQLTESGELVPVGIEG
jgi:hypothetical protein